eukprot:923684-Alexandrium_andersonii.AAC.1
MDLEADLADAIEAGLEDSLEQEEGSLAQGGALQLAAKAEGLQVSVSESKRKRGRPRGSSLP